MTQTEGLLELLLDDGARNTVEILREVTDRSTWELVEAAQRQFDKGALFLGRDPASPSNTERKVLCATMIEKRSAHFWSATGGFIPSGSRHAHRQIR
jgi:hypothetical protein